MPPAGMPRVERCGHAAGRGYAAVATVAAAATPDVVSPFACRSPIPDYRSL